MKLQKLNKADIIDTLYITQVSETTGEVIRYTKNVFSGDGIKKLKSNSISTKENLLTQEYIRKEIGRFFFYFYNTVDNIDMPLAHKTRFIYLSSFLGYNTENLVTKIEGKGNIYFRIKKTELVNILGLPDKEFRRTMQSLTKANIVYKDGDYYNIRATCSLYGENKHVCSGCTRVFIDNIRELYKQTDYRKHKQLYYLFKVLPYINLESNIICFNIEEREIYKVIPMTVKDIVNSIDLTENYSNKWYKEMRQFTINGNYVIMKAEIGDNIKIIINPRIYYGGSNLDNLNYIIGLFDSTRLSDTV